MRAPHGKPGGGNDRQGQSGKDLILKVPFGTLAKDAATAEILFDFTEEGEELLFCKGGRGGKGNTFFKSATHQAPIKHTRGEEGETKRIELELKLIADVGLVGFPNAGKSTLLSRIAKVNLKIAPYPFTTLTPNVASVEMEDFSRLLFADIPGILEKAHENRGLGLSFLRHIERTSLLVYVLDVSGVEGRDPLEDFSVLQNELSAYNKELLQKPFLIALNKIDVEGSKERIDAFRLNYPHDEETLFEISALAARGISSLLAGVQRRTQRCFS